ncbi:MAG: SGNH/GDSL hydrolase family protein [Rhodoferax sp.]|nr:SGNH/GDSL hydrolase family protein [Rhodoferax sp.]
MSRVALLGDSIFDNAAYTDGGPSVIDHLRQKLPSGWSADLLAVDGAVTSDVKHQLRKLAAINTHLVLSVGGNDALLRADVLETAVSSSSEAFLLLADAADEFETTYLKALDSCIKCDLPLVVCTIYGGNFPDVAYQRAARMALLAFNDVIIRAAAQNNLRVLDLRQVCNRPEDYANPIEPSVVGGEKIAQSIVKALEEGRFNGEGAHIAA